MTEVEIQNTDKKNSNDVGQFEKWLILNSRPGLKANAAEAETLRQVQGLF